MEKKTIRVINVPEAVLDDIGAVAKATGESKQSIYRQALSEFVAEREMLVAAGYTIIARQAELRKE